MSIGLMPPRSDFYVYVLFRHDTGIPFYVGKGTKRRIAMHKYRRESRHKIAIIKQAMDCGAEVPAVKLATGLTEEEAFAAEKIFISAIGREVDGGSLINLTEGGEGHVGHAPTAKTLAKISARLRGRKFSVEHKAKIGDGNRRRVWTEQSKVKASISAKKRSFIRREDGTFGGQIKCFGQS